jgi:endoglucanase
MRTYRDLFAFQVGLDYNAPFLTLAAYNVMQATSDPFYTSLQDGAYARVKPTGQPCDAAIQTGCPHHGLSHGARIAIAVIVTIIGLGIVGLIGYCFFGPKRRKVTY